MAPSGRMKDSEFCCTFGWLLKPVHKDRGQTHMTGQIGIRTAQKLFSMGLRPDFVAAWEHWYFSPSSYNMWMQHHHLLYFHVPIEMVKLTPTWSQSTTNETLKACIIVFTEYSHFKYNKSTGVRESKFFCCKLDNREKAQIIYPVWKKVLVFTATSKALLFLSLTTSRHRCKGPWEKQHLGLYEDTATIWIHISSEEIT